MNKQLSYKNWELYISRPFSLFGASLWNEWYSSEVCRQIIGFNIKNCLMIEHPRGVVRYYWQKPEQRKIFCAFNDLAVKHQDRVEKLLTKGLSLNKTAVKVIKRNSFKDFQTAIGFFIELSLLGTVLPFRLGESLRGIKNKRVLNLIKKLRSVSYYEKIIDKVIIPLARQELQGNVLKYKKEAINFLTLQEILKKKKVDLPKRVAASKNGQFFIYQNLADKEKVSWVKDPTRIIRKIEGDNRFDDVLRGSPACRGQAKGTARLVLTNEIKNTRFNKGDILVAISTSPTLMPLIRKCGAIVTDEGGLTCHAAIISRELKIPCVIGTKRATQSLRNGDIIEVNADKGEVRRVLSKK